MKKSDLRQIIKEEIRKILKEKYILHLKNDHPNNKVDKKIPTNSKPTNLIGYWSPKKLLDIVKDTDLLPSGTEIELTDLNNKVIKRARTMGWKGKEPIINDLDD